MAEVTDEAEVIVGGVGYGLPDSGLDLTPPTMHDIDGVLYRDEDAKARHLGPYADADPEGEPDEGEPIDPATVKAADTHEGDGDGRADGDDAGTPGDADAAPQGGKRQRSRR